MTGVLGNPSSSLLSQWQQRPETGICYGKHIQAKHFACVIIEQLPKPQRLSHPEMSEVSPALEMRKPRWRGCLRVIPPERSCQSAWRVQWGLRAPQHGSSLALGEIRQRRDAVGGTGAGEAPTAETASPLQVSKLGILFCFGIHHHLRH